MNAIVVLARAEVAAGTGVINVVALLVDVVDSQPPPPPPSNAAEILANLLFAIRRR